MSPSSKCLTYQYTIDLTSISIQNSYIYIKLPWNNCDYNCICYKCNKHHLHHSSVKYSCIMHSTHTVVLTMSEWIRATPLTACDPTTQRWAMLILFGLPSSIRDILHKRSLSPGYSAATLYNRDSVRQTASFNNILMIMCGSSHPDAAGWSRRWSAGVVAGVSQTCRQASAPEPQVTPCGLCMRTSLWWSPMPTHIHTKMLILITYYK